MRAPTQLSNFELMVMLALIRLGEEAYGVTVAREIEERTGRQVSVASLYAALERLETKGFATSRIGAATAERGGRAKRHFNVTPKGLREVRVARGELIKMWRGLPELAGGEV